jgi:hypothetical protein
LTGLMMGTAFLVLRVEVMERRPEGGIVEEGRVVKPPLSAQQHESQLSWGGGHGVDDGGGGDGFVVVTGGMGAGGGVVLSFGPC